MMIVVLVLLGLYLLLCAVLFLAQRSLLYFPQPRQGGGAPGLALVTPEGPVQVTVRPRAGTRAVIYFGGNAEDVSLSLPLMQEAFPDQALYLLHYRGYGGSAGQPSQEALFADALALFERVSRDHAEISLVGRSLGSGVAVYLASQRPVARLTLVTPYDSILNLAATQFRFFPVRWLLRDRFESWRFAASVTAPTLLLAADADEVIPMDRSRALLAHFREGVATLKVIPGTGHNSISGSPDYRRLLAGAL